MGMMIPFFTKDKGSAVLPLDAKPIPKAETAVFALG
jgi:hypothetical protein